MHGKALAGTISRSILGRVIGMAKEDTVTFSQGRQVLEIAPVKVSLIWGRTHLCCHRLPGFGPIYTSVFLGNNSLTGMAIHTSRNEAMMRGCLEGLQLSEADSDGRVSRVLKPHFPGMDISFFRKASRRPTGVAALVRARRSKLLFSFTIRRGAFQSKVFQEELLRTVRIELL